MVHQARAADNQITPGSTANPKYADKFYLQNNADKLVPAIVSYTTDGNSNIIPIGSLPIVPPVGGMTVNQGLAGVQEWLITDATTHLTLSNILDQLDVSLSTRASEATLGLFKTANHTDLLGIQTRIDTVSSNLAAIESKQDISNVFLSSLDSKVDTNLSTRASEFTLSTFASDNNTDLVGVQTRLDTGNTSLDSLDGHVDVNLSTRATEATLSALNAKFNSLGQKVMSGSVPVVIASDQSAIPVTQSGAWAVGRTWVLSSVTDSVSAVQSGNWDIRNITGTVSLPTGAATAALQNAGNTSLASIDSDIDAPLSTRASEATLSAFKTANHSDLVTVDSDLIGVQTRIDTTNASIGAVTESAAATDISTSGINGLTKRLNQHATTAEGKLDTVNSNLVIVQGKQDTGNASLASIDTKVSTAANQSILNTRVGDLTESAPASDTASSGLNGRLQRVAQNITTTNGKVDTVNSNLVTVQNKQDAQTTLLTAGNVSTASIDNKTPTLGQKVMSGSHPVVIASDQSAVPVSQSGSPWSQSITQVGGASLSLGQAQPATSIPVVTQGDYIPATQNVTTQDLASANVSGANSQSFILGTPTAGSAASFAISSFEGAEIQVTGIWTGTLAVEVSTDGGTLWSPRGVKQSGLSYISSSFTQNFWGGMNVSGITNVRARATAAFTGTAIVRLVASVNSASVIVSNPGMLRDGTTQSILNTIKAASTAAVATDTALVVAISPNNTLALPTGAATEATLVTRSSAANQTNGTQKTQVVDGSGNVQPSGDVAARASFTAITDLTNTTTVKAASTAAVATDKALVVAVSPNNTIPVTSSAGNSGTPTQTSVSCGATTTTLLAAAAATDFISIRNPTTSTVTIWINIAGASATTAAPSIDLAPGSEADYFASENSFLPTAQLNCISSGSASSVTLVYK